MVKLRPYAHFTNDSKGYKFFKLNVLIAPKNSLIQKILKMILLQLSLMLKTAKSQKVFPKHRNRKSLSKAEIQGTIYTLYVILDSKT